jgi:hypothetical protein
MNEEKIGPKCFEKFKHARLYKCGEGVENATRRWMDLVQSFLLDEKLVELEISGRVRKEEEARIRTDKSNTAT